MNWLLLICLLIAPATTRSATTKPSREREMAVLSQAVDVLTNEYRAVLANPEKPVRIECNFFKENRTDDVRPVAVLQLIEKRRDTKRADDVRIESYVKWQLLSAVESKFEDKLVKRATEAYRRTPLLMNRPGSSPHDQQVLDSLVKGRMDTEQEAIEYKLDQPIAQFNAYNNPVMHLRDALYERLPSRFESITAGFDDLNERVACAVDEFDFAWLSDQLAADTTNWMDSSIATPEQMRKIAGGIEQLVERRTSFYTGLKWREEERRLVWRTRTIEADRKGSLKKLAQSLRVRADEVTKSKEVPASQPTTKPSTED